MKQKKVIAYTLAAMLTACSLTACKPNPFETQTTERTEASTSAEQKPNDSVHTAAAFVNRLETALEETRFSVDYNVWQYHQYSDVSVARGFFQIALKADLSHAEQPRYSYSYHHDEGGEERFRFYDDGYLYKKENEEQYKYPASWEKAKEGIPFHPFLTLFGENWKEIFAGAELTEAENGNITAQAEIDLLDHLETAKTYLKFFGGKHDQMTEYDSLVPIHLSVTLDKNGRMVSYRVEMTMESYDSRGRTYPVDYTIDAMFHPVSEDFTLSLPNDTEREAYPESEPEISEITLSDFVRRYFLANENAQKVVYTKMKTIANVIYHTNGIKFELPRETVTQLDLSNPKKPHTSIVEIMNFFGTEQKTEFYYKDETYYCAVGNEKYSLPYPAEEYLAAMEQTAQEKAEAGVNTFFIHDTMLAHAILTVNPDQSVSALMSFDGETQRDNIFHNIQSVYNDNYHEIPSAVISDARVCMTLNRFNQLKSYILEVTVSVDTDTDPREMKYSIEYQLEYSETPREIDFPEDLNTENYPLRVSERPFPTNF